MKNTQIYSQFGHRPNNLKPEYLHTLLPFRHCFQTQHLYWQSKSRGFDFAKAALTLILFSKH